MTEPNDGLVAYQPVLRLLAERTGLCFPPHRLPTVESAIAGAMRQSGIRDAKDYRAHLETSSADFDDLVVDLTVGETYFFREPAQFEFLRGTILPELLAARAAEHVVRVWSAACASGEEPYSLAILFEQLSLGSRSRILATDISRAALAKARAARYRPWSLRGEGAALAQPYLRPGPHGHEVVPSLRDRVVFEYLNLALDAYPSFANGIFGLDLIFCRNVLIYFDPQTVRAVAERLFASLADGGWLFVAATDPPLPEEVPFEKKVTDAGIFYRRPSAAELAEATAAEPARPSARRSVAGRRLPTQGAPRRTQAEPPSLDPVTAAEKAAAAGDYAEAVRLTEPRRNEAKATVVHLRSLASLAPEQAAHAADEAAARHPLVAEIHYLRAVLLFGAGDNEEAAAAARRVVYLDRSLAIAHFLLGTILQRLGDLEGARRSYRNVRQLCASRPPAEPVPWGEGERAERLAATAGAQLAILDEVRE